MNKDDKDDKDDLLLSNVRTTEHLLAEAKQMHATLRGIWYCGVMITICQILQCMG